MIARRILACLLMAPLSISPAQAVEIAAGAKPRAGASTITRITTAPRLLPLLPGSLELPMSAAGGDQALAAGAAAPALPAASAAPAPAPLEALPDASATGKTWLLVGTRPSRGFILAEAVRIAKELGLNLVLLDSPENRAHSAPLVADSHFIPAPIDQRDDASIKATLQRVAAFQQRTKIDVVTSYRSHHAKITGRIVDEVKALGVSGRAVSIAEDKARTRERLNTIDEQRVAARRIKSAAEARQAYRELGGGKFVVKTVHGENSRFITKDVASEEAAAEAFLQTDAAVKRYARQAESAGTVFNRAPGILIERQLEQLAGTVESSVEVVMKAGQAVFAMISDTHGIGPRSEFAGGSLTFPTQQGAAIEQAFIAASIQALRAIGIDYGNARVDVMMTPEGARVIEVNPYMGGAAIWKAVRLLTGISLIEYDIRSHLKLSLPPAPAPNGVVDYRFAASQYTGRIESVEGVAEAAATPGVEHLQLLAGPGERIAAPAGNSFEEYAEIMGQGKTLAEARANSLVGLGKIKVRIWPEAPLDESLGDHMQPGAPPADAEVSALIERAKKEELYYDANRLLAAYFEKMRARITPAQVVALLNALQSRKGISYDPTHALSLENARDHIVDSYFRLNPPALTAADAVRLAKHTLPTVWRYRLSSYYQRNARSLFWPDVSLLLRGLEGLADREGYFHVLGDFLAHRPDGLTASQALGGIRRMPGTGQQDAWQVNYLIERYFELYKKTLAFKDVKKLIAALKGSDSAIYAPRHTADRMLVAWQQLRHPKRPDWLYKQWTQLRRGWPWKPQGRR